MGVSSLRRGHANLRCIVPMLTDDLRGESKCVKHSFGLAHRPGPHLPQPGCNSRHHPIGTGSLENKCKKLVSLLDLCVSSLRRGHANLLCIFPILTDDLRGESKCVQKSFGLAHRPGPHLPKPSCNCRHHPIGTGSLANKCKKLVSLLDLCVSSLRRGHANLLCLVPILTDGLRGESNCVNKSFGLAHRPGPHLPQPSCNCRHHPIGT